MALHFLDDEFKIKDWKNEKTTHELELFENDGELYLRVWVGGRGENNPICGSITAAQAKELSDAADRLSMRISDA